MVGYQLLVSRIANDHFQIFHAAKQLECAYQHDELLSVMTTDDSEGIPCNATVNARTLNQDKQRARPPYFIDFLLRVLLALLRPTKLSRV